MTMDIETLLTSELCAIALRLVIAEKDDADVERTDEEVLIDRFSLLIMLDEHRRAGAFVSINRYAMFWRVTNEYPERLPVVDRKTAH